MLNDVGISPLQGAVEPLSDDQLVSRLRVLCRRSKRTEVEIIRLLVVLQARHLDLHWTSSSLHKFCAERLGMTDGEATRRVAAARLVSKVPALLDYLGAGQLSMTTLLCLRESITPENAKELLARVAGKSKREVLLVLESRRSSAPSPRPESARAAERERRSAPSTPPDQTVAYQLDVVSGSTLHAKIELARELMGQERASDALVDIVDAAMDALITQLRGGSAPPTFPEAMAVALPDPPVEVEAEGLARGVIGEARAAVQRRQTPITSGRKPSPPGDAERASPGHSRPDKPSVISQALRRPLKDRQAAQRARERAASMPPESRGRRPRPAA